MLSYILALLGALVVVQWLSMVRKWRTHGGAFPLPIIGNVHLLLPDAERFYMVIDRYSKDFAHHGDGVRFFLLGAMTTVVWTKESMVAVGNAKSDRGEDLKEWVEAVANGVTALSEPKRHRNMRKLFASFFHNRNHENIARQINPHLEKLVQVLDEKARAKEVVKIEELLVMSLFDVMTKLFLGVEMDTLSSGNRKHLEAWHDLNEAQMMRSVVRVPYWKLPIKTNLEKKFEVAKKLTNELAQSGIEQARERGRLPADQCATAVEQALWNNIDGNDFFDDQDLRNHLINLVWGGHDSTKHVAACVVWELSRNGALQESLFAEVRAHLPRGKMPTAAVLRDMPLLDRVCNEGLRLHAAFPLYGRTMRCEVTLSNGKKLYPGDDVLIALYTLQTDENLWPDPLKFDPSRFEDSSKRLASSGFLPFGNGTRRCLGEKVANLNLRMLVAVLINEFSWTTDAPELHKKLLMSLVETNGVPVTPTRRVA